MCGAQKVYVSDFIAFERQCQLVEISFFIIKYIDHPHCYKFQIWPSGQNCRSLAGGMMFLSLQWLAASVASKVHLNIFKNIHQEKVVGQVTGNIYFLFGPNVVVHVCCFHVENKFLVLHRNVSTIPLLPNKVAHVDVIFCYRNGHLEYAWLNGAIAFHNSVVIVIITVRFCGCVLYV